MSVWPLLPCLSVVTVSGAQLALAISRNVPYVFAWRIIRLGKWLISLVSKSSKWLIHAYSTYKWFVTLITLPIY